MTFIGLFKSVYYQRIAFAIHFYFLGTGTTHQTMKIIREINRTVKRIVWFDCLDKYAKIQLKKFDCFSVFAKQISKHSIFLCFTKSLFEIRLNSFQSYLVQSEQTKFTWLVYHHHPSFVSVLLWAIFRGIHELEMNLIDAIVIIETQCEMHASFTQYCFLIPRNVYVGHAKILSMCQT